MWIQVLYQICDLQIFYHSVSYLFIYSVRQREEFLTAMNPNLSNFCLMNYILVLHLGNPVQPNSKRYFSYFLSLEILDFTFRCMIHFKLIFVYSKLYWSRIFKMDIQLSWHYLLKMLSFLYWITFYTFVENYWLICINLSFFSIIFQCLVCICWCQCHNQSSFWINLEVRHCKFFSFIFSMLSGLF